MGEAEGWAAADQQLSRQWRQRNRELQAELAARNDEVRQLRYELRQQLLGAGDGRARTKS